MESLIFDVDGTLWDAVALVAEGWNDGLQSMGFAPHCTEQSIRPLFGKTMTEIVQVVVPGVPQEQAMEVMDRCMDGEMARLRRDPCHIFYPGVKETLTELHKTHRLFIVSNCQQGYIELLMEKGGLGGLISDFERNPLCGEIRIRLWSDRQNICLCGDGKRHQVSGFDRGKRESGAGKS